MHGTNCFNITVVENFRYQTFNLNVSQKSLQMFTTVRMNPNPSTHLKIDSNRARCQHKWEMGDLSIISAGQLTFCLSGTV